MFFPSRIVFILFAFLIAFSNARTPRRSCPGKTISPASSSFNLARKSTSRLSSSQTTNAASSKATAAASLLSDLFPVPQFSKSWTTSVLSSNALVLADSTFQSHNILTSVVHTYTNAPDGKMAMMAHYPKGSYTFDFQPEGGFSFYASGPTSMDLTTAKEATFGYRTYFPKDFEFNLGGKLPGLYGGDSDAEALNCSGGRRSSACFSARLMWRRDGKGEFYTYFPPSSTDSRFNVNNKICNIPPYSECNTVYGASVGRGAFDFFTGAWTTVSERIRLNDVGEANGEIELFVNGMSVINVDGLILRDSAAGRIRGIQMQTFFGGSHIDFASPQTQNAYFADFSVAITETL